MTWSLAWRCFAAVWLAAGSTSLSAAPTFVDGTAASGLLPYTMAEGMGGGFAAADVDGDGDIDLFVPTAEGAPNQLYLNRTVEGGPALFEEVAASVGLASLERARVAIFFDADGDARLDLLVEGDCWQTDCVAGTTLRRLYRQGEDGSFVDVTVASGLFDDAAQHRSWQHRGSLHAGDVDQDGDPDFYTTMWQGGARLFENDGDGFFVDVSESKGAGIEAATGIGPWQSLFQDFNGDGRMDIFVAVDFVENRLFIQQADGKFVDRAPEAGLANAWNEMGVTAGDIDFDGDLDLYLTNISDDFFGELRHSMLYRNDSSGDVLSFVEISQAAGVDDAGWGWGATLFDVDHDGDLDLAATNGFSSHVDATRLFENVAAEPTSFIDRAAEAGIDDMDWGSALAAVDFDRDGDLDLLQSTQGGPLRLWLNQLEPAGSGDHYLVVRPERGGRWPRALGARVEVELAGQTLVRTITAGTSFMAQEPAEAHFGLGTATHADRVVVYWPGGGTSTLEDIESDQVLRVTSVIFEDGFESGGADAWSASVP